MIVASERITTQSVVIEEVVVVARQELLKRDVVTLTCSSAASVVEASSGHGVVLGVVVTKSRSRGVVTATPAGRADRSGL